MTPIQVAANAANSTLVNCLAATDAESVFYGEQTPAGLTEPVFADAPIDDIRVFRLATELSQDLPMGVVPEWQGVLEFRPDGTMMPPRPDPVDAANPDLPPLQYATALPGSASGALPAGEVNLYMPQGTALATTAGVAIPTLAFCKRVKGLRDGGPLSLRGGDGAGERAGGQRPRHPRPRRLQQHRLPGDHPGRVAMSRRPTARRGAALIIALVILAAMLMLGLPFLFTQSFSLAGTRSFAHNQQARLSADTAENAGIDIVGTAMSFHFANTGPTPLPAMPAPAEEYTSLYWSLRGGEYDKLPHFDPATQTGTAALPPSPNHVHLDLRQIGPVIASGALDPVHNPSFPDLIQPGLAPGTTPHPQGAVSTLGLAVEDEGGKLDPNYLDAVSWMNLLAAERIADAAAIPGQQGPGGLALALAQLHNPPNSAYPGLGHITYLEQLLAAVPAANTRLGLTRTELELLRPLLSFSNRAPGRAGPRLPDLVAGSAIPYVLSGPLMPGNPPAHAVAAQALTLIDLGTLLNVGGSVLHLDSVAPARLLGNAVTPALLGSGTTLVVEDKGSTDGSGNRLQIEHVLPNNQAAIASAGIAADIRWRSPRRPASTCSRPRRRSSRCSMPSSRSSRPRRRRPCRRRHPTPWAGPTAWPVAPSCARSRPSRPPPAPPMNAFALTNPLFSSVVLGTGTALPTSSADIALATGTPTLPGPGGLSYAAANDQNNRARRSCSPTPGSSTSRSPP